MSGTAHGAMRLEEVSSVMTPAEGVDIYDALKSAELSGYRSIVVHLADDEATGVRANTATITWYKRESSNG